MTTYQDFLDQKAQLSGMFGFKPISIPDFLFDFQKSLVEWSLMKGRAAIFADCGLGKTPMQLAWADNVVKKENKPVLILTPLSVGRQTVKEGEKFGIECERSMDGKFSGARVVVTNYERLHYFNPGDFAGAVCDESSILKNFDGVTKDKITEFMRRLKYRLLCTATAAPNDYIELGTSSEALGDLGYIDMLKMFFKADNDAYAQGGSGGGRFAKNPFQSKFRFRGHAEKDFWRWICSWARAVRKPSDLGFPDGNFQLPKLITEQHVVEAKTIKDGCLFSMPAHGLQEEREERRRTIEERCARAADLVRDSGKPAVIWCNLNDESSILSKSIGDAREVSGSDSDEEKEEAFADFESGKQRVLVTKATIAGLGLNWQHCAHATFFPSHSFEQWYQAIRRFWRFGQKSDVHIDVITSEGESAMLGNMQRKSAQSEVMFGKLVELMTNELSVKQKANYDTKTKAPKWL